MFSALRMASPLTVLALALSGLAAAAAPAVAAGTGEAPACVTLAPSWRYTLVTNGCAETHTVRVLYTDGTPSPCRAVEPRATVTFAGYGTDANHPVRTDLCDER
ncbi:alpha-amylase [Streptomyces sp. DH37]|uniref:alpha-amylase n=1 Tax=Streptomyces sp. DH37 TaxID=3040122 RepID=UPI002442DB85|nr:alpha-amylase [Streptomyces sp. DH37]MDG9701003.1 alpha-amylase [Streptomyces sp. DH37]